MRAAVAACAVFCVLALGAAAAGEPPPDPAALHRPSAIAEGLGGDMWVVDDLGIMRVARDGRMTRVLEAPGLGSITRGPDQAMWFTVAERPSIGRIAPDGSVEYFSGGISRLPRSIVTGRDGNLWFTEGGRVARITPAGVVTEFRAGLGRNASPGDVALGPDGNVWFTDSRGAIGRITPHGAIREFPVGTVEGEGPEVISAGPDGALWFGQVTKIGRITTSGRVRRFDTPFYGFTGMTRARGALWVTGSFVPYDRGAVVARFSARHSLRLFNRGLSGYETEGIARAADGSLWVIEDARRSQMVDPIARLPRDGGRARETPPPPRCHVPKLTRYPLFWIEDTMFDAYCKISARSRRAGKDDTKVVHGTRPPAGSVQPFDKPVDVRFGAIPPLPKHCRVPFGGRREASSPTVLAYSYTNYDPSSLDSKSYYGACLRPHGALRAITSAEHLDGYDQDAFGFETAGDFVAYRFENSDKYGEASTELSVYDVRSAHHIFAREVEHLYGGSEDPRNPRLGDYVVSEHGAVAWLSIEGSTTRLRARARGGSVQELDSGASLSGLSFSGDTLSWTGASGERKSADVR
jgi:streptogramin lyase